MKKILFFKFIVLAVTVCVAVNVADAQARRRRATATPKTQNANVDPFGNPVRSSTNANDSANQSANNPFAPQQQPATNNNAAVNNNPSSQSDTIPIEVVPVATGNPLTSQTSPSLRNDFAVEQSSIRNQIPLDFDPIREDDAVYTQRLWSVIDIREKMNQPFRNPRIEDNGSQLFFAILYRAITQGEDGITVTAFEDENFRKPISKENFLKNYAGGYDTVPFRGDLENPDKITKYEVRATDFPVDSVYKFMIKEDVIFDKEASRLVRRIIGIAPMMPPMIKGKLVEGAGTEAFPMFWLYYNDLRPILAKYRVYNAKNYSANMSWDDLFQAHMYSSYIVKTSKDNPKDLALKDYISDPLFRLLEGEKIKKDIFDYEQNLWQY